MVELSENIFLCSRNLGRSASCIRGLKLNVSIYRFL